MYTNIGFCLSLALTLLSFAFCIQVYVPLDFESRYVVSHYTDTVGEVIPLYNVDSNHDSIQLH